MKISPYQLNNDALTLIKNIGKRFSKAKEEKILSLINAATANEKMSRYQLSLTHKALGDCYYDHKIFQSALTQYELALQLNKNLSIKRRIKELRSMEPEKMLSSLPADTSRDILEYPEYKQVLLNYGYLDFITIIEDLPFKYVSYPSKLGIFICYQETPKSDFYLCECERIPLRNYLVCRQMTNHNTYNFDKRFVYDSHMLPDNFTKQIMKNDFHTIEEFLSLIKFKPGLCHKCNKKIPQINYRSGTSFKDKFGWYIEQQSFIWIDDFLFPEVTEDHGPEELYQLRSELHELFEMREQYVVYDYTTYDERRAQDRDKVREIDRYTSKLARRINNIIENKVREDFGYNKVGEGWVSETSLYYIIKEIFPNEEIKRHYRPEFLEGLELDIFLPGFNIGIEYQGIQHFIPIKYWGGETAFKSLQERDRRKKRLCANNHIELIYFNYDDEISSEFVRAVLMDALKQKKCNSEVETTQKAIPTSTVSKYENDIANLKTQLKNELQNKNWYACRKIIYSLSSVALGEKDWGSQIMCLLHVCYMDYFLNKKYWKDGHLPIFTPSIISDIKSSTKEAGADIEDVMKLFRETVPSFAVKLNSDTFPAKRLLEVEAALKKALEV